MKGFRHQLRKYAGRPVPVDKRRIQALLTEAMSAIFRGKGFGPMFDGLDREIRALGGKKRLRDYDHGVALKHNIGRYKGTTVDGVRFDIPVYLKVKPSRGGRDYITGGRVEATREGEPRALILNINNNATPERMLRDKDELRRELYSVLIHEATHVHDVLGKASGDIDGELSLDERNKIYYNLPHEVRAFMQQVVDEALESLEDWPDEETPRTTTSRFIMDLLIGSDTWFRVAEHMSEANTRKILRAVARAVSEKLREGQD